MQVQVVEFETSDLPALVAFVEALQDEARRTATDLRRGRDICDAYARLLIQEARQRNGIVLLAKLGSEAIGFACAWVEQDDDLLLQHDARRHAYISDIFVAETARRQGVATRLLKAIEAEMRHRGCRRARVHAKAGNRAALKCYEARGYDRYEIIYSKSLS